MIARGPDVVKNAVAVKNAELIISRRAGADCSGQHWLAAFRRASIVGYVTGNGTLAMN